MKILICVNNLVLSEGLKRILCDNFSDAIVADLCSEAHMVDPDLVLFESNRDLTGLIQTYQQAKFVCLDLGMKEAELARLLYFHGISGIISTHLSVAKFCKALKTVLRGEIWVEQTHLKALLREAPSLSDKSLLRRFSEQDKNIIAKITEGLTNKEIAEQLNLSEATIKAHVSRLYRKLNIHNRSQLVALSADNGM